MREAKRSLKYQFPRECPECESYQYYDAVFCSNCGAIIEPPKEAVIECTCNFNTVLTERVHMLLDAFIAIDDDAQEEALAYMDEKQQLDCYKGGHCTDEENKKHKETDMQKKNAPAVGTLTEKFCIYCGGYRSPQLHSVKAHTLNTLTKTGLTPQEINLVKTFRQINPAYQKLVPSYIQALLETHSKQKEET